MLLNFSGSAVKQCLGCFYTDTDTRDLVFTFMIFGWVSSPFTNELIIDNLIVKTHHHKRYFSVKFLVRILKFEIIFESLWESCLQ